MFGSWIWWPFRRRSTLPTPPGPRVRLCIGRLDAVCGVAHLDALERVPLGDGLAGAGRLDCLEPAIAGDAFTGVGWLTADAIRCRLGHADAAAAVARLDCPMVPVVIDRVSAIGRLDCPLTPIAGDGWPGIAHMDAACDGACC